MRRLIALVLVVLAGCSSGRAPVRSSSSPAVQQRPSSTASVRILEPANGSSIRGGQVHVRIALDGGRIVPLANKDLKPNEGHVHIKLDGELQSITAGLATELRGVKKGSHLLQVEFVASDHGPFDPRVIMAVTFVTR